MADFLLHVSLLRLPYFWDEAGYYIPAARDLLLTGRIFDAAEAHHFGLVNEVVASGKLMERARELAGQIMENSPSSVRLTKKLINGFIASQLDAQIDQGVQDNAAIRQTADFREGVSSFLEKRKPQWSGK